MSSPLRKRFDLFLLYYAHLERLYCMHNPPKLALKRPLKAHEGLRRTYQHNDATITMQHTSSCILESKYVCMFRTQLHESTGKYGVNVNRRE